MPRYPAETRIKEIIQKIIENDGLTKKEIEQYYKEEFGYNIHKKPASTMLARDMKDLVIYKIIWFNEDKKSNLYTINKNFNFNIDNPVAVSAIYTMFFYGFKKGIIGKNDVLRAINPTIFNVVGDYEIDFD